MRILHVVVGVLVVCSLSACSTWFRDRASDYQTAKELPPLVFPEGQEVRPVRPLYPIPPGEIAALNVDKRFKAPKPKPLVLPAETEVAEVTPAIPLTTQRPVLGQDGTGYPAITVAGDYNVIWDRLGEALKAANVKVDDRDQRVGLYFLKLTDANGKPAVYQLRVGRNQSGCILTLQQDDDTLAPQGTTKTLFELIVRHWPSEPGEKNGKA